MKISIIGGGISGLSLGCFLQIRGYDTEVFEKHSVPGGLCASWKKGEFTFDGCLHWVLGSDSGSPFYKLWSELLDMKSIEFVNHEIRVAIELKDNADKYGSKVFQLYTNIDKLETYLLDLAPEDKDVIRSLVKLIRVMQSYELPPMIENISQLQPLKQKMGMIKYLPFIFNYLRWKNETNFSFARKFKNRFVKEAFELLFDGDEVNLMVMAMPLAYFDKKSAGYPVGGSAKFAGRVADKYKSLGGTIRYNSEIKKIVVEDNIAKGVMLKDGATVYSDITVSAADWHFTVFKALDGRYLNDNLKKLAELKRLEVYPSIMLVSLGVSRGFKEFPHFFRFPMEQEYTSPDGTVYNRIEAHIYHYDQTVAPNGKTVIAMSFYTRNGEFWINLRESNREEYNRCKTLFAAVMIDYLDKKLGGVKESIEESDVSTPATYHRYTGNWKGSAQGWFPAKSLLAPSPVSATLPGLKNFYYTSHWSIPGGGLPSALKSAHDLAQIIDIKLKQG
jgi:phytoene dehydrogenase-like protein